MWTPAAADYFPVVSSTIRLLRGHGSDHSLSVLLGRCFDFPHLGQLGDHRLHDLGSFFNVGQLTATEEDGDLHFVFVLQEALRLFDFEVDVVLASLRAKADFLRFGLVSVVAAVFLLVLFVLELAEVHDSAHGWLFVRSHFHQVQAHVSCAVECFVGRDDPKLRSIGTDDANRGDTNLIVDTIRRRLSRTAVDCFALS
jgi:hypothetical protein